MRTRAKPIHGLHLLPHLAAATTHDYNVFSFHHDNSPCHGFEEVLACYRKIVPHLRLSGSDDPSDQFTN
jgi:hypothetical protein